VGLIVTIDRRLEAGSWLDLSMFVQNVMLAAAGRGLQSCPQETLSKYHRTLRPLLSIPEEQMVVCGISLGKSTSVLISLGLPHAPSFLRAICSIPLFGIAKVAANVCSPEIPTKMPTNRTAAVNFYACFQRATKIFLKIWNQTSSISYCYCLCFQSGAPGRQSLNTITN
jgi:hypothetical protein